MTSITFSALKDAIAVQGPVKTTLKLRRGGSVIVGSATVTDAGNIRVTLANNANSVVVTPQTNFIIEAEVRPVRTAATVLDGLSVGARFSYVNRFGTRKDWVKTGSNRFTRVGNDLPAVSYSVAGFPSADASSVVVY